ncbi:hypothetical protein ACTFIF_05295, partial [Campylobacter jejuni]
GFVENSILMNGKYRLFTTRDIREAKPFTEFLEAEKFLKSQGGQFWGYPRQYFCIMQPALPTSHQPEVAHG